MGTWVSVPCLSSSLYDRFSWRQIAPLKYKSFSPLSPPIRRGVVEAIPATATYISHLQPAAVKRLAAPCALVSFSHIVSLSAKRSNVVGGTFTAASRPVISRRPPTHPRRRSPKAPAPVGPASPLQKRYGVTQVQTKLVGEVILMPAPTFAFVLR